MHLVNYFVTLITEKGIQLYRHRQILITGLKLKKIQDLPGRKSKLIS